MHVVFIAGPFAGANDWERAENVRTAERVALAVARCGAMPICPHTNTGHFFGTLSERFWRAGYLEVLGRCDAIVMVPDWEESTGSQAELEAAKMRGLPVFLAEWTIAGVAIPELAAWARGDHLKSIEGDNV